MRSILLFTLSMFLYNIVYCQTISFKELTSHLDKSNEEIEKFLIRKGFSLGEAPIGNNEIVTFYKDRGKPGAESIGLATVNVKDGTWHSVIFYNVGNLMKMNALRNQIPFKTRATSSDRNAHIHIFDGETDDYTVQITVRTRLERIYNLMLMSKKKR